MQIVFTGWVGSNLELRSTTILWLILSAIVAIGLAGLRGQAAGIGHVTDDIEHIKSKLEDSRPAAS